MTEENNEVLEQEIEANVAAAKEWSNLPLIILLVALTIYFAFQTLQLISERSNLGQVKSNQDAAIQEAQKVQTQFKTLVTKTSQLADQGHAGAKMVMEELQKRGVGSGAEPAPPETKAPESKAPAKEQAKPAR